MSVSVIIDHNLITNSLIRRFAPFKTEECKLPGCYVRIIDSNNCQTLYGILTKHLASQQSCSVNTFMFASCEDGILISDDSQILAWVHDKWRRIDVIVPPQSHSSVSINTLTMRAYQYIALHSDALLVHAAAVNHNNQAILFCGIPGAGKSTQARLWEKVFLAEAINNDQPCIVYEETKAFVCGTPWSGKEPCYKNMAIPVRAIVFVEKSQRDFVETISPAEAYGLLYLNQYLVPIQAGNEEVFDAAIKKIVATIPVYRQYCTMTENAPKILYDFLFAE